MRIRFRLPTEWPQTPPGAVEVPALEDDFIATTILAGLGLATFSGLVWYGITGLRPPLWFEPSWKVVLVGVGFMVVHELIHLLALPSALRKRATLGILPYRFSAFVLFSGTLSRTRSIAILISPFLALTVVPLLIVWLFAVTPAELGFVAIWNAFASCFDLALALTLARVVPRGSDIGWGGERLHYFRPDSVDA